MPNTFIFGFGTTLVQCISVRDPATGHTAYGVGLINTGEEHEAGSVPTTEEAEQYGLSPEFDTIALSSLDTVLWFSDPIQRDIAYGALTMKQGATDV